MCLLSSSHQGANGLPVVTRVPKPPQLLKKIRGVEKSFKGKNFCVAKNNPGVSVFVNLLKSISHFLNRRPSSAQ
jgi:hypothetical protein